MNQIIQGDCLEAMRTLPDNRAHCCVTSPPYWGLRNYGHEGQLGLEKTPDDYVNRMVEVFREVRRVLRDDGTLWLNLGDSYGVKSASKQLVGIPWRVAFALQADGWYLRQDIIWHKPNPMPESVRDRCTKAHEYLFLLSKSARYFYDVDAVKEPSLYPPGTRADVKKGGFNSKYAGNVARKGDESFRAIRETRNRRSVWTVSTRPYKGAHFATFPPKLIEPCILAGCPVGGIVLDPFFGSGTTGAVAVQHGRQYLGIELNPEYIALAQERINKTMEDAPPSLEQRVAWLETQVQAQGAKLRKIEANQQLSLFCQPQMSLFDGD